MLDAIFKRIKDFWRVVTPVQKILVFLLGVLVLYTAAEMRKTGGKPVADEGGLIIVDSPEVYSRERLVNDRFRQSAWLEDELKNVKDQPFGNQAIADMRSFSGKGIEVSANMRMPGAPETISREDNSRQNGGSPTDEQPGGGHGQNDTTVSPAEKFRDMLAYREEIRTEIMETMLDDRHDIKGNTLYRLKFDATIFPYKDSQQWAFIHVSLKEPSECNEESDKSQLPCMSMRKIHQEWANQTELNINETLDGLQNAFLNRTLKYDDATKLFEFLERRISSEGDYSLLQKQKFTRALAQLGRVGWTDELECYPRAVDSAIKNIVSRSQKRKPPSGGSPVEIESSRLASELLETGIGSADSDKTDVLIRDYFGYNSKDKEQLRYNLKRRCVESVYPYFKSLPTPEGSPAGDISGMFTGLRATLHNYYFDQEKDSPAFTHWLESLAGICVAHKEWVGNVKTAQDRPGLIKEFGTLWRDQELYGALWLDQGLPQVRFCGDLFVMTKDSQVAELQENTALTDFVSQANLAEKWEISLLRSAIADYLLDRFSFTDEEKREQCNDMMRLDSGFSDKLISCFSRLDTIACKLGHCRLKVELNHTPDNAAGNDGNQSVGHLSREDMLKNFSDMLNQQPKIYSYAITPKESAQRYSTIENDRRQNQMLLSLFAGLPAGTVGSASAGTVVDSLFKKATYLEQVRRQPLILSFGRGQLTGVANEAPNTDFGWIVGPKYQTVNPTSEESLSFTHVPVQNSLSAVVSIPSWWTTLGITVETCWIDQRDREFFVSPDRKKEICRSKKPPELNSYESNSYESNSYESVEYVIRLPGSPAELPRKFEYEIERVPRIEIGLDPVLAEFYVGQANASLLIMGAELWRSTVVTLGSQKANKIEVLPNMKGIIATFNEIYTPDRKMTISEVRGGSKKPACVAQVDVYVWTSEGKTRAYPALIYSNGTGNQNLNPEGFGPCVVSKTGDNGNKKTETRASDPNEPTITVM